MVTHAFKSQNSGERDRRIPEFKTSLVYRENTRTARDTGNNSVWKNQRKEITREGRSFLLYLQT